MELSADKEKLYSADEIRQRLGISTCGLKKGSEPGNGADFELLAELAEHGFRKVEVGADYGPDHFDYHNLDSIAELRHRYEDCGAAIYSVHAPYGYLPVVAGDPDANRASPQAGTAGAVDAVPDGVSLYRGGCAEGGDRDLSWRR